MNKKYDVTELVPHSGRMSLLNDIVDYGEGWLQAEVRITRDSTFADAMGVPAWIGLEYMAQAIAAYSGLQERRVGGKPKIGFLLGSRKYHCDAERFEIGATLSIRVEPEVTSEEGMMAFNCKLQSDNAAASAIVNVFQPRDADAFLQAVSR